MSERYWDGCGYPFRGDIVLLSVDNTDVLMYGADQVGKEHEVVCSLSEENCVVLRLERGLGVFDYKYIKPVDLERAKCIDEMNKIVGDIEKVPTWTDALEALYNAGYRKQ